MASKGNRVQTNVAGTLSPMAASRSTKASRLEVRFRRSQPINRPGGRPAFPGVTELHRTPVIP